RRSPTQAAGRRGRSSRRTARRSSLTNVLTNEMHVVSEKGAAMYSNRSNCVKVSYGKIWSVGGAAEGRGAGCRRQGDWPALRREQAIRAWPNRGVLRAAAGPTGA